MVRIAVLVESERLPAADAYLLDELLAADYVDLRMVVVVRSQAQGARLSRSARTLLNAYRWMDAATSRGSQREATRALATYAPHLPPEKIVNVGTRAELSAALTGRDLEVVLGPSPIEAMRDCTGCATFGVWWIGPREGSGCLRNLYATAAGSSPLFEVLWASTPTHPEPSCLELGCVPLVSGISVAKNLTALTLLSRNLWLGALSTLSARGWEVLRAKGTRLQAGLKQDGLAPDAPVHDSTSVAAIGRALVHMGLRQLRHRSRRRNRSEHWCVGVRPIRDHGLSVSDTKGYRWLQAPPGRWYADPFVLSAGDKELLYMEEFNERTNKGRIVCGEVDARGRLANIEPVLEPAYHAAYPCVFEHDHEIFMIPETGFNNTVELYRSISLPSKWELVRVLYSGPAFDTSVLYHDGRFWFFTSLVEGESRHTSRLLLFHSDRIDGEWTPHPSNPISNDARFARGGGAVFRLGSQIVRPAQDGGATYGGAVRLRSIQVINESEYAEAALGSITPSRLPNAVGLHTYNRSTRTEVIDCRLSVVRRR
jgi:hypothetical protein